MSNIKIENLENNVVKITIPVSLEKFEEGMEASYNRNKGQVNIPGFRKGKVPRKIIEQTYGKEFLQEDAINFILPELYDTALFENNIVPVSRPSISMPEFLEDEVLITATLFKKPEVVVTNYKGVEIPKIDAVATEEDVLKAIENERENNARLVNKNDGKVEDGNVVKIDFAGYVDGVAFDGGTAENYDLTIGSKTFIDTFEEQVIGHTVGEEFDVNVTFPEGYQNPKLSGQPAVFKVKVNEINEKELPEVDDEFAQSVSEFDTLEEYKANLLETLSAQKAENAIIEKESKVLRKIIEDANLDVPPVMIENRISQMIADFDAQIKQQGLDLETYLGFVGQTMDTLRAAYAPDAKTQVHGRLVLEAIGKAEDFEITDEEFNAEIERIAAQYQMPAEQLKSVMRPEDIAGIREDIATQKALKFIVDEAIEL